MSLERKFSNFSRKSFLVKNTHTDGTEQSHKGRIPSLFKYPLAWILYVLIGSYLFLYLETSPKETVVHIDQWIKFKDLIIGGRGNLPDIHEAKNSILELCSHEILTKSFDDFLSKTRGNSSLQDVEWSTKEAEEGLSKIENECGQTLTFTQQTLVETELSMVDAIYYTMTLVTTIGFGHISPTTTGGKLFCIPFSLVGVPLTCILLAKSSDMLSKRMLSLYESARKRYKKHPQLLLFVVSWMFLIAGCLTFMFLPSLIFVSLENWTLVDAFYFSFITLSTIGFGDFIAGYGAPQAHAQLYKMFIVAWVMVSLGYWVFLLNFLQKAIKSNATTLKKKLIKGKNLSKQAEFLKNLISKVRQNETGIDEGDYNEKLQLMTLIVESLSSPEKRQTQRKKPHYSEETKKNTLLPPKAYGLDNEDRLDLLTSMVEYLVDSNSRRIVENSSSARQSLNNLNTSASVSSCRNEACVIEDKEKKPSTQSLPLMSLQQLLDTKISVNEDPIGSFAYLLSHINQERTLESVDSGLREPYTDFKIDSLTVRDLCNVAAYIANRQVNFETKNNEVQIHTISSGINSDKLYSEMIQLLNRIEIEERNVDISCPTPENSKGNVTPLSLKPYLERQGDLSLKDSRVNIECKGKNGFLSV